MYIHPKADTDVALNTLSDVISSYENADPETLTIVAGDFNRANLKSVAPKYRQFVTCPTRGSATLDHCYCPVKGAYKSIPRASLGNSDHSVVFLIPAYKART